MQTNEQIFEEMGAGQDEGRYYDQEMADIIADAADKEVREIYEGLQVEADAEYAYLQEQADIRATQESWGVL